MIKASIGIAFLVVISIIVTTIMDKIVTIVEIPHEQINNVLTMSDLSGFVDTADFTLIPDKKGIRYPYTHTKTKLNGISFFLRIVYKNDSLDKKTSITTSFRQCNSDKNAQQLFNNNMRIGILYNQSIKEIESKSYGVDEVYCIENEKRFYLLVRISKIVYYWDIENCGITIKEEQIRNLFKNKLSRVIKEYR